MQRLNAPLDVDFINKTFFPNDIPKDINTGRCFLWAYIAFCMYEGVQLWDICAHAFVKYDGKFYDSEKPLGEEDWKDLPATNFGKGCSCRTCRSGARRHTVNSFKHKSNWGRNATNRKVSWTGVRFDVERIVERKLRNEI